MTTVRQSQFAKSALQAQNALTATSASYALNGGSGLKSSGSLLTTASFNNPNLTFTKGDKSTFNVNISSLTVISASHALTASFINGGIF